MIPFTAFSSVDVLGHKVLNHLRKRLLPRWEPHPVRVGELGAVEAGVRWTPGRGGIVGGRDWAHANRGGAQTLCFRKDGCGKAGPGGEALRNHVKDTPEGGVLRTL